MRLAAAAFVLALASPVWASEGQIKRRVPPKSEQKQGAPQQKKQDPAAEKNADSATTEDQAQKKKKNCPTDMMSFNTLEDMYGFVGEVDSLTAQDERQVEQATASAKTETAAVQDVQWRTVEESEEKDIDKDEAKKSAEDEKPEKSDG
jgi:hypothetical protein